MNHNKYICIIEDTTDGQDEYTNLNDLRSDLNTDLGMIGLCVIDIKRYNVAPVSAPLFGRAMLVLKALQLGTKNELHPEIQQEIASICAEFEAVAPVSAEQPTKCPTCGSTDPNQVLYKCGVSSCFCAGTRWHRCYDDKFHYVVPPSVSSCKAAEHETRLK